MSTNLDLARQVAKHVQLTSVALRNAYIESNLEAEETPPSLSVTQQHRCSVEEKVRTDRRELHVLAEFKFFAHKDEAEDSVVVKLDAAFSLVYFLPSSADFEPRCVQHFADINGAYNAWPYWRELVQSAAGRVGLAGILVPVYRPVAQEVDEKKATSNKASASSRPGARRKIKGAA